MPNRFRQIATATLLALVALAASAGPAPAQGSGTITGRVTDRATGAPLGDARVVLIGTQRDTRTNEAGQYRLTGVPPGAARVRVMRLGYSASLDSVQVTGAGEVTLDVALVATITRLDQVTVSATGASERQRETGNSIAALRVDSIPTVVVSGVNDLLSSRAASVTVTQTSGTSGTGSRIRIRGSNSVSLSNEPLVIIDGIRSVADPAGSTISLGGQNPTRLDDLNPDDIENIEIIKGPAAAALYGTAAANGVIQITTRRGKAGRTRWNFYGDGGRVEDVFDYPANYARVGTRPTGARTTACTLVDVAGNTCTPKPDSLVSWTPIEDAPVFVRGWRSAYGLSASGGTDRVQYFLGGDYTREQGVYPNNAVRKQGMRANLNGQLSPSAEFGAQLGYHQVRARLPQNDNNDLSPIANSVLGSAFDNPATRGYIFYPPSLYSQIAVEQAVDRVTSALNGTWRPASWLSVVGLGGVDYAGRTDQSILPPDLIPGPDNRSIGQAQSNPYSFWTYTGNVNATATWHPLASVEASTSLGTQFNREILRGTQAAGRGLAAGTGSLGGTTSGFAVNQQNQEIVTLGAFAQQRFAWRDKLFLTASLRGDDNSNFGQDLEFVTYPAASLSWVMNEESWFPQTRLVSSLRLRAAAGQSGQRPGFRNAVTFYNTVAYRRAGNDLGGVELANNVGNATLKPEKSTEYEGGLDVGLFGGRASLEVTAYHKTTRDALIQRNLPPSTGAATRFENLGEVTNRGFEATLLATLLDTRRVRLDLTAAGSTNRNELVTLGAGVDTIFFGLGALDGNFSQRVAEGHPVGGYWQLPYTWSDANGDGIIRPNEVTLGENSTYLGQPLPTREVSLTPALTFYRRVRLTALFNYRGGHTIYNAGAEFRCAVFVRCEEAYRPGSSLGLQARRVAGLLGTSAGYIEDASFWRLREVAVSFDAPSEWARRLRASSMTLTLAGRNLALWTNYTGFDPEITFNGTSNYSTAEFFTQPPVRYLTARLALGW